MSPKISNIKRYSFNKNDNLLLDTNIWMSIYGPIAHQDWRTSVYSRALRNIIDNGGRIFLDVLILSEFINAFARFEYRQLDEKIKPNEFKDFRDSALFEPIAQEISINAKKIVKVSQRCDSIFESVDLPGLLSQYEKGNSDFNDQILVEICKSKGLTFVTHDKDFKNYDVNILTASGKLLNPI